MADYWKSQARKFCDFCKCWIADNKPSIQFHETGKRHKENVAQKLAMLTKRSVKEKKESLKVDEEMRKMEEAAMKAYLKDMESNPDYTSKVIIDKVEEKKAQLESQKQLAEKEDEEEKGAAIPDENIDGSPLAEEKVWYEAQSDEGYTYYWNYLTGESVWEPPKEGYLSIEEQQKSSSVTETKKTTNESETKKKPVENVEDEKVKKDNKKRKKDIDKEKLVEQPRSDEVVVGPSMKPDPYGGWSVVENSEPETVDLQLPHQEYIEIKVPIIENEQPQIKFKEKLITSLDDKTGGPSTFKKRKFNANRSNMRRKFGDDDGED